MADTGRAVWEEGHWREGRKEGGKQAQEEGRGKASFCIHLSLILGAGHVLLLLRSLLPLQDHQVLRPKPKNPKPNKPKKACVEHQ